MQGSGMLQQSNSSCVWCQVLLTMPFRSLGIPSQACDTVIMRKGCYKRLGEDPARAFTFVPTSS